MDEDKRITLRLPADLHERLTDNAKNDRRSLNSQIVHLLEIALSSTPADAGPPGGGSASSAPLPGKPDPSRP